MKEYDLYLFIDEKKLQEIDRSNLNPFLCKYINYVIMDQNQNIISQVNHNNIENPTCELYKIQVFDNLDENNTNFLNYLFDNSSNYRIIDTSNNLIISYNKDDLEILSDLIKKYGDERINLYYSENEDEIKKRIHEYKFKKNAYLSLSGLLGSIDLVALNYLSEDVNFIPLIIILMLTSGVASSLKCSFDKNIDLTINKRQYKQLKRTKAKYL